MTVGIAASAQMDYVYDFLTELIAKITDLFKLIPVSKTAFCILIIICHTNCSTCTLFYHTIINAAYLLINEMSSSLNKVSITLSFYLSDKWLYDCSSDNYND